MANIKELKSRIKSTKGTLKITSAMKLVSAAKLARAQGKIQGFKPYANELASTVRACSARVQDYTHEYLKESTSTENVAFLVISSDKGLCGGYNAQLLKKVRAFIAANEDKNIKFFFIGKKVREIIEKEVNVGDKRIFTFKKVDPSYGEIQEIAKELSTEFTEGRVDEVHIAYNSFISAIEFDSRVTKVLPMTSDSSEESGDDADFLYEPNAQGILDSIIPESFVAMINSCLLDAVASEHGSRMAAMDSASSNCKDMIKSLTLKMNKLRQAAITTELTEIVSGAESLNS